jgi:iron complex transport system permease protein
MRSTSLIHGTPSRFFAMVLAIVSLATLATGATAWEAVWPHVLERVSGLSTLWNPLLDERLPRLIVTLCTGASLAVAGAVTQALFCNPIASPSSLGMTTGGSLLAVGVLIFGWHIHFPFAVAIAAFLGCLLTLLFVYSLSKQEGQVQMYSLILTGIAVSTVLMAVQGAVIYAMRDQWQLIQAISEWEAGSTYDRTWQHVHLQLPLAAIGLFGCWYYSREINILALGEEEAANLGVDVAVVRWRLFLCVALLTGGALASMGIIAFFGLVLPHLMRRLVGTDHSRLIPLCMIGGATILASLDLMLRLLDIHAFSIGNISAVLGGSFFLVLLFQQVRRGTMC